jgi:hypothetical protein
VSCHLLLLPLRCGGPPRCKFAAAVTLPHRSRLYLQGGAHEGVYTAHSMSHSTPQHTAPSSTHHGTNTSSHCALPPRVLQPRMPRTLRCMCASCVRLRTRVWTGFQPRCSG